MENILKAFALSLRDFRSLRILAVLFIPALVSLVLWIAIYSLYITTWVSLLSNYLLSFSWITWLQELVGFSFNAGTQIFSFLFSVLLFLPLTYLTTVLMVSFFAMPVIIKVLNEKNYPQLEKKESAFWRNIWNTTYHGFVFLLLFVFSLPLWLVPGFQILVPILLTAALNRRVFTYDALADFCTKEEISQLQKKHKYELLGMGLLLGIFSYIPLLNFIMPVFGGLAYSHYCFQAVLQSRRP